MRGDTNPAVRVPQGSSPPPRTRSGRPSAGYVPAVPGAPRPSIRSAARGRGKVLGPRRSRALRPGQEDFGPATRRRKRKGPSMTGVQSVVRVIMGTNVLLGAALTYFVHPLWVLYSAFV